MTDATETVLRFRLILQDLWNNYCWRSPDLREVEVMHQFERLKMPLYRFFVFDVLATHDSPDPPVIFGPAFRVVPRKNASGARKGPVTLQINVGGEGVWREFHADLDEEHISFHLIDFFNWRLFYWRDYSLYRVKIDVWKDHEDKVGLDALIDVLSVEILCDTSAL